MQQRWAVRRTKKPKNVGDGEALSRKRKLCVFSRRMQTGFNGRTIVVDQDRLLFITTEEKENGLVWLAVESYLHPLLEADLIDEWLTDLMCY